MLKGKPCKVAEVTTSKTGKHGHAKAHIVAVDIFTSKKYEDLCPCSHNMEVPFVKREELQVLSADLDSFEVSLLLETGETRDDLNLPNSVTAGNSEEQQKTDQSVAEKIVEEVNKGEKNVIAIVQSACGIDKIVDCKLVDPPK